MSEQPSLPTTSVNSRGAVDLSNLAAAAPAASPPSATATAGSGSSPAAGQDSWVLAVTPQDVQQVVQLSSRVPVLLLIHGPDELSQQFHATLADAVDAQAGRIMLATLDASAYPELAQQAGELPLVTAFLAGQPLGEFDGKTQVAQLPQVVSQMLQVATQNGISSTVPPQSTRQAEDGQETEEPLPPLHQKAHDALESGDYAGAVEAYEQALKEKPDDAVASLGLAQVRLIQRTQDLDLAQVRQAAAENPDDVQAQIQVADMDVLGGHVDDAFARLVTFVQTHAGDDREAARQHVVELYRIVGDADPRVAASRRRLANALF